VVGLSIKDALLVNDVLSVTELVDTVVVELEVAGATVEVVDDDEVDEDCVVPEFVILVVFVRGWSLRVSTVAMDATIKAEPRITSVKILVIANPSLLPRFVLMVLLLMQLIPFRV
jgi:hypothetical protein